MNRVDNKIRMYARGNAFRHGTPLDITIEMLSSFNNTYTYCLNKFAKRYGKAEQFLFLPQLNIEYVRKGSLSSLLTVDFPAAYAMIAPTVYGNAWELLKQTINFAQHYIKTIKTEKVVPQVHIENSPNSTNLVFIATGNAAINAGKDIVDTFKHSIKDISNLAGHVEGREVEYLDIKNVSPTNKVLDKIRMDRGNSNYLTVEEREIYDPDLREYPCRIYSFNVRSGKGRLDIIREDSSSFGDLGSVNFEVEDGTTEDYIDAMKQELVVIVARSKAIVNTLGERKITYLYPVEVLF